MSEGLLETGEEPDTPHFASSGAISSYALHHPQRDPIPNPRSHRRGGEGPAPLPPCVSINLGSRAATPLRRQKIFSRPAEAGLDIFGEASPALTPQRATRASATYRAIFIRPCGTASTVPKPASCSLTGVAGCFHTLDAGEHLFVD